MSSSMDLLLHPNLLLKRDLFTLSLSFLILYLTYSAINTLYVAFFGPLSKYPGPKLRALSRFPRAITLYRGTESTVHPALHKKYGPVVRIAPRELSYATGAQAFRDIDGFKKPGTAKIYKDPFQYQKPFNGVDALISADDATHARQRKLIMHAFSDRSLRDLEPVLKQWCGTMREKLEEKAVAGEKVDMLKYYNCTTFDIMGDLSFNEGLNMLEDGEYSDWVKAIFLGIKQFALIRTIKYTGSLGEYFVNKILANSPAVRKKQAEHWNYSKERVDRRLAKTPERVDLWSKILEKGTADEGGLSRDEHHSLASLFMVAGTETTATALSGTTYWLLKNPEYLRKVTQEIRESHASYENMTLESVSRLKYLQAVLNEGLRIYPPVPSMLPRRTPKGGSIICGEFVPEDTTVGVHQLATYRNEDNFKKAYEFHPQRWLGDAEFKDDHLDALEPFLIGPRNCVGKNLAWHEMRLLLATTLLHFDLELCEESNNWEDQRVYVLWEKKALMCRLTPAKRE